MRWLEAKTNGKLGEIRANTHANYRRDIVRNLLPVFGVGTIEEIDRASTLEFKALLIREARELRETIAAGKDLRDERNRRQLPLGPESIRKVLQTLAAILDAAVEDDLIPANPARGKRMRVRAPKPCRTFLEMDELALLLEAAAEQEEQPRRPRLPGNAGRTASQVAHLVEQGYRPPEIAKRLRRNRSTVTFHLRRLDLHVGRGYVSRRVALEILGRSGVRVSELCNLRIGDVRLHGSDGGRFHIRDSKTDTGIREVQMTPNLTEAITEHIVRLRRAGLPADSQAYLVPNLTGGHMCNGRAARIVSDAAVQANERLMALGLPPLPHTTPHTLRRTYISIALLANNFDVKWVMSQVGHADSRMTMDVYAQLEQRAKRSHGSSFDRLIRQAAHELDSEPAERAV